MPKTLEDDLLDAYATAYPGLLLRESQIPLPGNSHSRTRPEEVLRSRTPLLWRAQWMRALEPLRRAQPSLFFTEIPLGPECDGAQPTRVNLLRVLGGPGVLAKFETPERLRRWVDRKHVELIEVRKKARRGVVGRPLAHQYLLPGTPRPPH